MNNSTEGTPSPVPPPRWKRWLQNCTLALVSLSLCIGLCEVALRLAGYGNVEIYDADPVVYWKLKPNQDCFTKIDRKPVHINSLGTRGREFTPQKPPNTLRILSLGDSKTFGWGLTEAESYSGRIEKLLQDYLGNQRKVEVINSGVNAYSYPQMRFFFRDTGIRFQPDIVILADANLWTQFSEHNDPKFVKAFMNRVRLKNFLRKFALYHYVVEVKLKEVYEKTRARFVPVDPASDTLFKEQQQKDPDAFFRSHIEGLCSFAISNRVQPVLLFMPTLDQLEKTEVPAVLRGKRQVAEQLHVPLIDTTSDLKPRGKELYLDADPVHFNVAGNEIIAQRIFQTLTNLITKP